MNVTQLIENSMSTMSLKHRLRPDEYKGLVLNISKNYTSELEDFIINYYHFDYEFVVRVNNAFNRYVPFAHLNKNLGRLLFSIITKNKLHKLDIFDAISFMKNKEFYNLIITNKNKVPKLLKDIEYSFSDYRFIYNEIKYNGIFEGLSYLGFQKNERYEITIDVLLENEIALLNDDFLY